MDDKNSFMVIIAGTDFAKRVATYLYKTHLMGRDQIDPIASFQSAWYEIAEAFKNAGVDIDAVHQEVKKMMDEESPGAEILRKEKEKEPRESQEQSLYEDWAGIG